MVGTPYYSASGQELNFTIKAPGPGNDAVAPAYALELNSMQITNLVQGLFTGDKVGAEITAQNAFGQQILAAKADIVVLCSSDDEYAEYAVPAFKALNGRAMFIVAGAPACMDDLKAAGIENFIHVRVNVLETLKEFNAKLLK